ncbi:MAG: aldose 1-epimerase family protein [Candidatus Latescibacterota bacterium]|nr:aldose 1-epimerase family protein [Candidatus Latescibacterota bacterium]
MAEAKTWVLTDQATRVWVDSIEIGSGDLGLADEGWSIRKTTLRGGPCDGVDIIEVDNGALSFSVLPTRGMGIWKGAYKGLDLAWNSPVKGPVHPSLIDLQDRGGLGWLAGFDEVVVRCGLDSMGAPGTDVVPNNMGVPSEVALTLHGKIANTPASRVEVQVIPGNPTELVVIGEVHEAGLFCPQYRLLARASTKVGSNSLLIEDEVRNEKAIDAEMELLYHCNFGPPFLEEGARLEVAAREVAPRDARAAEGLRAYETYTGPTPGYVEQAYWYDLLAGKDGKTLAMLRNFAADKGVVLRFDKGELPAFTQWKNTASIADGYVTGLEPATDYPNSKAFERQQGRLMKVGPGETRCATLAIEVLDGAASVAATQGEIANLQQTAERQVHSAPISKYSDL